MSVIFDIEFKFRPVGQGLFYTGVFEHHSSNSKFTMVYDCGTDSVQRYINREIDRFSSMIPEGNKLDLLIISHFHKDHVSHIPDLLRATNGVKLVILPYLSPDELLLGFIENYYSFQGGFPQEYFDSPTTFFKELGADEIIFMHPEQGDILADDDINPIAPQETVENEFKLLNRLQKLDSLPHGASEEEGVTHCYGRGSLICSYFWEFKFFNKVRDQTQVDNFLSAVKDLTGVEDLSTKKVSEYFRKKKKGIPELRNLYNKHFKSSYINDTSLVVYHNAISPIIYDHFDSWILRNYFYSFQCTSHSNRENGCGNLLTGDINIDDLCLDQITVKWSLQTLQKVIYAQIPHHGAAGYLIPRYFQEFPSAFCHIINFGLGNKYGHPRQVILDMIEHASVNNEIYTNTQISDVTIKYFIVNETYTSA